MNETPEQPWKLGKTKVNIRRCYEAVVEESAGKDWLIVFGDWDGKTVEGRINKKEFRNFPYEVKAGTHFGLVVYRMRKRGARAVAGAWPVVSYWDPSHLAPK